MGGFGSGRRPEKLSVNDCRQLDIGLLCDGGALGAFPRGQFIWQNELQPERLALLDYWLVRECWPDRESRLLLCCVYWPTADARPQDDEIELTRRRGVRTNALCPACSQAARKLYAPPGAIDFSCRVCQGLIYPPSTKLRFLPPLPAELVSLAAELTDAGQGLPAEDELSELGPQESRLACLHLHTSRLSLRQIAARVGISKSSVHRYLAAGTAGIDAFELASEQRRRLLTSYYAGLTPAEELRSIHRWIGRRGPHRHSATEHDTVQLILERANSENRESLRGIADRDRCYASLRERGQHRLALEVEAQAQRGK